ncbi:PepSY domain-containing protein [Globicatella sulfidifaciens]|uniref:PepSY domain-containing protein n=1 Tax=Globicatella sulfidifaciens TaxID=136093 RepID=UPI0028905F81|nr:PepSY domain-containing protein [Globicatella sulfidifaciens]MDT2767540.1 PepSY domain-containing protein [Globicatella sulfidifaciens]
MSQNKNNTLAGLILLATGLVVGAAGALFYRENQPKKANLVLEDVKEQFQNQGTITGSWIDYEPVEYEVFESKPLVYLGGISRQEADGIVTYNFIADAFTGEILDIYDYQA